VNNRDSSKRLPLTDHIEQLNAAWPKIEADIVNLLRARLKSLDEAREAAQETYLLVRNSVGSKTVDDLGAFAYRVAERVAGGRRRERKRHLRLNMKVVTEQEVLRDHENHDSPERAYAAQQALALAERAFEQLPAAEKQVCEAHLNDERIQSIAARLDIKQYKVYRLLRAAHERLAAATGMRADGERDHE
jgi:RNA polymerase sigma factor (sigma-70 family)